MIFFKNLLNNLFFFQIFKATGIFLIIVIILITLLLLLTALLYSLFNIFCSKKLRSDNRAIIAIKQDFIADMNSSSVWPASLDETKEDLPPNTNSTILP